MQHIDEILIHECEATIRISMDSNLSFIAFQYHRVLNIEDAINMYSFAQCSIICSLKNCDVAPLKYFAIFVYKN